MAVVYPSGDQHRGGKEGGHRKQLSVTLEGKGGALPLN